MTFVEAFKASDVKERLLSVDDGQGSPLTFSKKESFMLDFYYPETQHMFGLPERSSSFLLGDGEYRMYPTDLFPHQEGST